MITASSHKGGVMEDSRVIVELLILLAIANRVLR